ncbi:MAG: hypothetical protein ACE366_09975 [Bradymonadia bacterium]
MRRFAHLFAALCLAAGCASAPAEEAEETPELIDPPAATGLQADGKADSGYSLTPEQRAERTAVLKSIRARVDEQIALKRLGVVGESVQGYVAVPPEGETTVGADADLQKRVLDFIEIENVERDQFYTLETEAYRAGVMRQIDAQRPEMRRQVTEQLCKELDVGGVCSAIAGEVIDTALEEALKVAVDESMAVIRNQVERLHAKFWQRKTTPAGTWIEVDAGDEGALWIKKR